MTDREQTCGACRFSDSASLEGLVMRCRVSPPAIDPEDMSGRWPLVWPDDWCGSFAAPPVAKPSKPPKPCGCDRCGETFPWADIRIFRYGDRDALTCKLCYPKTQGATPFENLEHPDWEVLVGALVDG